MASGPEAPEAGRIAFLQGNEVVADAALYAGLGFYAGYPITPSTEIAERLAVKLPARGGSARADVIIASGPIYFPKVLQPNVLVCLSRLAYDKYAWIVRPGGVIVLDTHFVTGRKNVHSRQVALELHRIVVERFGSPLGINMCVLGALAGLRLGHDLVKGSVELY